MSGAITNDICFSAYRRRTGSALKRQQQCLIQFGISPFNLTRQSLSNPALNVIRKRDDDAWQNGIG